MGLEGGKCPNGSKKDKRKIRPNPSGCRRSRELSPRRSYVRKQIGPREFKLILKYYGKDFHKINNSKKRNDYMKHYTEYKKKYL
jgi:hypothetical protein